jgi:hypothetical protein
LISDILSVIDKQPESNEKIDNWQSFNDIWASYIHGFKQELPDFKQSMKNLEQVEFTTFWLEQTIEKLEFYLNIGILLTKDNERIKEVITILRIANRFASDRDFDNRESCLNEILRKINSLEKDILEYPTPFAFEAIRHILPTIKTVTENAQRELYTAFKPELSVDIISSNTFLSNSGKECEMRFTLKNKSYCQTVREIVFTSSTHNFSISGENKDYIKGGGEETLVINVKPTELQIKNKAFQFDLTVTYKYYEAPSVSATGTMEREFSINLFNENDFIEIDNPYMAIDTSGEVRDESMFFGRGIFIDKIVNTLQNKDGSLLRSKCIALFGQKRAGKSSILYHLEKNIKSAYS